MAAFALLVGRADFRSLSTDCQSAFTLNWGPYKGDLLISNLL